MANINNLVLESFSDTYNSKTPSGQTLVKSILGGVAGAYILQQILTNPIQLQSQLIGIPTIFECDDKISKLEKYKNKTLHLEKSNYIEYTYSNRLEQLLNSMYFKIKFKPINLFNNIEILGE